jgi:folylpolyglutamate synthase/dihydropteroate synthase
LDHPLTLIVQFLPAHTPGSATALGRTLKEVFPSNCIAMVVAMASDKDHEDFARALLQGDSRPGC